SGMGNPITAAIAKPLADAIVDYDLGPRVQGLTGTVMASFGVAAGAASGNVLLTGLSLDQMYAQASMAVFGTPTATALNRGLQEGLGLSPAGAAMGEMALTMGAAAGPAVVNALRSRAALSVEGATVRAGSVEDAGNVASATGRGELVGPTIPADIAANRQAVSALGIPNRLSPRQELHIPPVSDGRSVLTTDPSDLVQGLVDGNFRVLRTPKSGQAIVDFGRPIGDYWRTQDGVPTFVGPTNYGSVMFGKNGTHIVPANPLQW
ncbi:hypothetical protein ABIC63_005989, partial [Pseudacidovorax sp. 1753]|uniref:polymorphic toxin type 50 domain-containing protein n=1 Tax=Pseudacidovorax sp. 1753 TaxID=3156419 RepID=UPI003393F0D5